MADEFWTLNFYMKDAPSGEKFLEERMDKDLISYFDILGIIEKQGYTSMDYLFCRRYARPRSELVQIINDLDVSKMVCEHEVDQKLSFYVSKQIGGLNTRIRRCEQVHIGSSADAERRQALSDEGVNGSGYDTEASYETDREAEKAEQQAELEAMKRHRADPNVSWKRNKRPRNSRFQSEDQEQEEEEDEGDLDDPMEPVEDEEEDEEILHDSPEHSENEDQDLAKLDTTVSWVSLESGSIKIIWSNGVVQEYRGRFTVSNVMNIKSGGKVLVETDKSGIPNQRSAGLLSSFLRDLAKNSSHVPLHIPRWDNKLMLKPKKDIITYVETKFMYPNETKYTTEGWMLKIVNKGWRAYKSFLKKEFYKPDKWSLDRIKRRVPSGVSKHQWITLLGTWCQEQHAKTCLRNSEAGKQQRHPHTTGRKSHARLKKEMEVKNKGPVSKVDLWDEAHKRKDGEYTNDNVQQLMHKARKKLANLERKKKGELSQEDYDKVFDDVIAKESKIGGYYDEKYWGDANLCRGSTSVQGSSSEVWVQNVTRFMERMYAFMARNHPNEDWVHEVMAPENEIKTGAQPEEDPSPMLQSNSISVNTISDKVGDGYEVDGVEEPMDNVPTTESDPKVNVLKGANNIVIHNKVTEAAESNEAIQTSSKNTKCARTAKDKEHCQTSSSVHEQRFVKASETKEGPNRKTGQKCARAAKDKEHGQNSSSPHEQSFVKELETKEVPKHRTAQKTPKTVVLISLAPRNKNLVVGKGIVKSRDSNYVVGGDTLGDAYWAIAVLQVSRLGRERLPRPVGDIQTVQDAIGHCIAWPSTHVKRLKDDSN